MIKKTIIAAVLIAVSILSGCASVPMAPMEQDIAAKKFIKPTGEKAGLYVFRDTFVGQALKKTVSLDGAVIGETANKVFFYKEITPGSHTLSTESEFSDNSIDFQAEKENNYFAEQYIKMGVFVGGAGIQMVSEEDGKKGVLGCQLAE
jgi:protein involved in sex pheromone biosynthesis